MNAGLATAAPQSPPPGPSSSAVTGAATALTKPVGASFSAHLAKATAVEPSTTRRDDTQPVVQAADQAVVRPAGHARDERVDDGSDKADNPSSKEVAASPDEPPTGSDSTLQSQAATQVLAQLVADQVAANQGVTEPVVKGLGPVGQVDTGEPTPQKQAIAAELALPAKTTEPTREAQIVPSEQALTAEILGATKPASAITDKGSPSLAPHPDLPAEPAVAAASTQIATSPDKAQNALEPGFKPEKTQTEMVPAEMVPAEMVLAEMVPAEMVPAEKPQADKREPNKINADQGVSSDARPITANGPERPGPLAVGAGRRERATTDSKSTKMDTTSVAVPQAASPGVVFASLQTTSGHDDSGTGEKGRNPDSAGNLTPETSTEVRPVADFAPSPEPAPVYVAPQTLQTAAVVMKAGPQTVTGLAAQIVSRFDEGKTRFEVELHPLDLGRVDVQLEVGASGQIRAAMSFDTPQAAAEMRARSADLQKALETAGFNLNGGLSFDVAGDRGQGRSRHSGAETGLAQHIRTLETAATVATEAAVTNLMGAYGTQPSRGVDIRI
ncbi:MAG: hypothetical protein CGW95_04365 [Phenylobacterium zucineum]|nr:MAG: hypothetical protein CGW95_04365 [Phenylobacterium zucineum]